MKTKKRQFFAFALFAFAIVAGIVQYNFGPFNVDGLNLTELFNSEAGKQYGDAVYVTKINGEQIVPENSDNSHSKAENPTHPGTVAETPTHPSTVAENSAENSSKTTDEQPSSIDNQNQDQTTPTVDVKRKKTNEESAFEQARIERDEMRSRSKEQLQDAVSAASDNVVSTQAQQSLLDMTNRENTETKIESILGQKGFKSTLVYIGEDNSVDIVVKSKTMSSSDAACIADTAARQANVDICDVVIKCLN